MKEIISLLTPNNIPEVIAKDKFGYITRIVKRSLHRIKFIISDWNILEEYHDNGWDVTKAKPYNLYKDEFGEWLLDPQFVSDKRYELLDAWDDLVYLLEVLETGHTSVPKHIEYSRIFLTYDNEAKGVYICFSVASSFLSDYKIALKTLTTEAQTLVRQLIYNMEV